MSAGVLKIFGRTSKVHEAVFIPVKNESNAGYVDKCVSIVKGVLHDHDSALGYFLHSCKLPAHLADVSLGY